MTLNRPRTVSRWIGFFCFLFLINAPAFGESAEELQNKLISDLYMKSALEEYNNGSFSSSLKLTDISISFNSDVSDAYYLKAKILLEEKKYSSSKREIEQALLNHNWKYFNDFEGRLLLAEIQFQLGDAGSAYLILIPYKNIIISRADAAEIYIRIAVVLGKIDDALKVARLFPDKSFAQKILVMNDFQWRNEALRRIRRGDLSNLYAKEVLQELIMQKTDFSCSFLMKYYSKRWGEDRFYLLNSLCFEKTDLKKTLDSFFKKDSIISRKEIWRIKTILDRRSIIYNTKSYFSNKSFVITDDMNNDGITDSITEIVSGAVKSVKFDFNQDGNAEYKVICEEGVIKRIDVFTGKDIKIKYLPYPYIHTYTVTGKDKQRHYTLIPYNVKLPLIVIPDDPVLRLSILNRFVKLPSDSVLQEKASDFIEKDKKNQQYIIADRTSVTDTIVKFLDKNGEKYREREYHGTLIKSENEDIDGDGIPDIFYTYKNGKLNSVAYDENHNGNPEYKEEYQPLLIKMWDFDDNGITDYKDYYREDIHVQEFATDMNGNFNLRIEKAADGRIEYFLEDKVLK